MDDGLLMTNNGINICTVSMWMSINFGNEGVLGIRCRWVVMIDLPRCQRICVYISSVLIFPFPFCVSILRNNANPTATLTEGHLCCQPMGIFTYSNLIVRNCVVLVRGHFYT